jgi:uncharacterized protein YecT (DUF1311 family)
MPGKVCHAGPPLLRQSINPMIRSLILALGCLAFLDLAIPSAWAQSQYEMNQEAGQRLEKAKVEMDRIYKKILKQHANDQRFVAILKEGQQAWLKSTNLHLDLLFYVKEEGEDPRREYGSMFPMLYADAKAELVTARTKQLRELQEE